MKKIFVLAVLLAFVMALSGCGKSSLSGTYSQQVKIDNGDSTMMRSLEFSRNGTVKYVEDSVSVRTGTYELNGNKITIDIDLCGNTERYEGTVSGNKVTINSNRSIFGIFVKE